MVINLINVKKRKKDERGRLTRESEIINPTPKKPVDITKPFKNTDFETPAEYEQAKRQVQGLEKTNQQIADEKIADIKNKGEINKLTAEGLKRDLTEEELKMEQSKPPVAPTQQELAKQSKDMVEMGVLNSGAVSSVEGAFTGLFATAFDVLRSALKGQEPKKVQNAKETLNLEIDTAELAVQSLASNPANYGKVIAQLDTAVESLEYLESDASVTNDAYLDTYLGGGLALEAYIKNRRDYITSLKEQAQQAQINGLMAQAGY